MKNIGDIAQICGIRRFILDDGPGRGMRVFEVRTGSGLTFSVLPDRGMDIGWCHYNSTPIGFISKTGAVSPSFCEYPESGFLRGFMAGLLTTCGYTHMGAPCIDDGKQLGLHGRATALVSDNTTVNELWEGDEYIMRLGGTMRESAVFGENIQVRREIMVAAGTNRIIIRDVVENNGFDSQPLMLLYHFNFGYPLLSSDTKLVSSDCNDIRPRDKTAEAGLSACREFQKPAPEYAEQVFSYDLIPDKAGYVFAGLSNPELNIAAKIRFRKSELPYLIQWKQMGEQDYTCGIEPATWRTEGRDKAREQGGLIIMEPGERRTFNLEFSIEQLKKED